MKKFFMNVLLALFCIVAFPIFIIFAVILTAIFMFYLLFVLDKQDNQF